MTGLLTTLQQWLLFCGTIVVLGCVAWRALVVPRARRALAADQAPALGRIHGRVARMGLWAALVLFAAWILRMLVQVMAFRDPFAPLWDDVSLLLFQTFWGTVWMAQGLVLALLAGSLALVTRTTGAAGAAEPIEGVHLGFGWSATAVCALALTATLALSSHAVGVDAGRAFAVTADGLHLLAAGVWIGSLTVIVTVGRGGAGDTDPAAFAAQLRSFSPLAMVGVATLVTMGGVLSWTHLTTVSDLWGTTYGRILSGKVGLAIVVLALGFWNWRKGLPASDTPAGAATLRRRAGGEVTLAIGVVLLTAILVHSAKP